MDTTERWERLASLVAAGDTGAAEQALADLGRLRRTLEHLDAAQERQVSLLRSGFFQRGEPLRRGVEVLERALGSYAALVLRPGCIGEVALGSGCVAACSRGAFRPLPGLTWAEVVNRLRAMNREDALILCERVDAHALCRMDRATRASAGVVRENVVEYAYLPGPRAAGPDALSGATASKAAAEAPGTQVLSGPRRPGPRECAVPHA